MSAFDPFHAIEEVPAGVLPQTGWSTARIVASRGAWFVRLMEAVKRTEAVAVAALLPDGNHRIHDVSESGLWRATDGALHIWVLGSDPSQE